MIDVLKCITSDFSNSGGTLKIESSDENKSYNNNMSNNNEQEEHLAAQAGSRKRTFDEIGNSAASASSGRIKTARISTVRSASRLTRHDKFNLNEDPIESNEDKEQTSGGSVSKQFAIQDEGAQHPIAINDREVLPQVVHKVLENIPSICQNSASFAHMVYQKDSLNANEPSCSTVQPNLIASKETTAEQGSTDVREQNQQNSFQGFVNTTDVQCEKKCIGLQDSSVTVDYKANPASKIPSIACIAQQYADSGSMDAIPPAKCVDFLELSKKYHFNDNDIPSFRLFDYVDDNGKTIEEPELWRPLEMGPAEYAKKIKEATARARNANYTEGTPEMCDDSIQCAQKQRSDTCSQQNLYEAYGHNEGIINIDSNLRKTTSLANGF